VRVAVRRSNGQRRPRLGLPLRLLLLALVVGLGAVSGLAAVGLLKRLPPRRVAGVPLAVTAAGAPEQPPVAAPRPVYELGTHPLLSPGVPLAPVTCALPEFGRSAGALTAYYQAAIGCLDAAWQPVLANASLPFVPPILDVTGTVSTACGTRPPREQATAFYCGADHTLTMPRDRMLADVGSRASGHLAVLAHEYGHHVQSQSGILRAAQTEEKQHPKGSPAEQEMSRRVELQANCFSGMFLAAVAGRGSITKAFAKAGTDSFRNTVADGTHGTVANQVKWGTTGYRANHTAACNTFVVPGAEVG